MRTDVLNVEILPDGTLKISTDKISMPNHQSAEAFVKGCQTALGGKTDVKHKHGAKAHTHSHEGEHEHTHE